VARAHDFEILLMSEIRKRSKFCIDNMGDLDDDFYVKFKVESVDVDLCRRSLMGIECLSCWLVCFVSFCTG